jgi:hypothetical protein
MTPSIAFVVSALLATYVAATPVLESAPSPLKLSISKKFNSTQGFRVVDVDRARIAGFKNRNAAHGPAPQAGSSSFPVTNVVDTYTASVGVGSPPTFYNLLIDTGSSNTWVRVSLPYFYAHIYLFGMVYL